MSLISVDEALRAILALMPRMPAETVALREAAGRVLAADVCATRDQPPFAASAMDGYAVRAAEARLGATLALAGTAAAGHAYDGALPENSAIRIFTGAPVPAGADAILIQENAAALDGAVRVLQAPAAGEYVRPAAGDFAAGTRIAAPLRIHPRHIALFAAMNIAELPVSRRPRIAIIPTGDELVMPGEPPRADQIVSSNNFGLAALVASRGAAPELLPVARDTPESLADALGAAQEADVIVTLGGASVGDHDLVGRVAADAGLERSFYKVAMRPGKPLIAGRLGKAALIGLPGNPVSAMICGEIFLAPAIEAALGLPARARPRQTARLARALPANGPREHYMRAVLTPGAPPSVEVFENQDSSLLHTLSEANAVAVRAPHAPAAPAGSEIDVVPLDGQPHFAS